MQTEDVEPWRIIHVAGELDMASGPVLRNELVSQITEGHIHLAVNLHAVDFIDSTGLGVLIGGLKRSRSRGGDLRVVNVPDRIMEVFDLTGLTGVFSVVDSADQLPSVVPEPTKGRHEAT